MLLLQKNKSSVFGTRSLLVYLLIFICASTFCKVYASDINENGYLYSSPSFNKGSYLKYAADSMDFSISQRITSEKPYRFYSSGSYDSSMGLIITSSGSLLLSKISLIPKSCLCCRVVINVGDPVSVPISVAKDVPIQIVCKTNAMDTSYVLSAISGMRLNLFTIGKNGTIFKSETLQLSGISAGREIRCITGSFENKKGFWIGGTKGMVRYLPIEQNGPGNEMVYDIDSSLTISYADQDVAYTQNGAIYEMDTDAYSHTLYSNVNFQYGNKNVFAGDGQIVAKINNRWKVYQGVFDSVKIANVIRSTQGTVLEWIDRNWLYNRKVLSDSVTEIANVVPVKLNNYINTLPYEFTTPESLTIFLTDADSNTSIPDLMLKSKSGLFGPLLYGLSYNTVNMGNDVECQIGVAKLNADSVKIILQGDSVLFESNFVLGGLNPICNTCTWTNKKIRFGKAWDIDDTLIIRTGTDTLNIYNNFVASDISTNLRKTTTNSIIGLKNSLRIQVSESYTGLGVLTIWTINGKILRHEKIDFKSGSASVPLTGIHQMVIARIHLQNGFKFEQRLPLELK